MSLLRINRSPSSRQLLTFSLAWAALLGASAFVAWSRGRHVSAGVTAMAAVAMPGLWFSAQRAVRWTFVALSYATYPIGLVVSCVVLVCLYFGVVTPIGIVARLFGHDPLASRFAPGQPTYWQPRQPIRDVADYFRQR